jgi:molecular chaperone GrpE
VSRDRKRPGEPLGSSQPEGPSGPDGKTRPFSEGTPLVPEEERSDLRVEESGAGDEIERARAEAAEYLADLQRLKAEFDNYRKRVLREQTQAVELAAGPLVIRLLEVLDEFELALTAAERVESSPGMDRFVHGVEIVYAKLMEILKAEGLERIEADGAPFDPELHEALLQGGGEPGGEPYIEDVLRTGYTLKGRVIRPAGVKVSRR